MLFMPSVVRDLPTMKSVHFPVFEVITPVTGVSFEVRGLTVAQESALYESAVSQQKYISMINQTLFECIENKVAPYDTLEGFEKNLTESDRYALMYGVLVSTYGDEIETTVVCRNCGKENKMKIKLSEYMTIEQYKKVTPQQVRGDSDRECYVCGVILNPVGGYRIVANLLAYNS